MLYPKFNDCEKESGNPDRPDLVHKGFYIFLPLILFLLVLSFVLQREKNASVEGLQPEGTKAVSPLHGQELNRVRREDLEKVRGIGAVLSQRIINRRDSLGGFHDWIQLREIPRLSRKVIGNLQRTFQMTLCPIPWVRINHGNQQDLSSHPYLSAELADQIVDYRENHGFLNSWTHFEQEFETTFPDLFKIRPYLCFEVYVLPYPRIENE
ncbi:MAG: helix-hairpin-helix domain-containing protein [Cytophagales bacterium]|nr:helix-hairpin-helix domain-containing protein [Cytophagales bacterium]